MGSEPLNGGDRLGGGGLNAHVAGVDDMRILGCSKRGSGTVSIAFVTGLNVEQHVGEVNVEPEPSQLFVSPLCADLRTGGNEQFRIGVGRDDRADVASIEHGAAGLFREIALAFDQGRANRRIGRDARGYSSDRLALQLPVANIDLGEIAGAKRCELAFRIATPAQEIEPDRTVEEAGIEMRQAEPAGDRARDRAFSACRESVNRNDHRAPSLFSGAANSEERAPAESISAAYRRLASNASDSGNVCAHRPAAAQKRRQLAAGGHATCEEELGF